MDKDIISGCPDSAETKPAEKIPDFFLEKEKELHSRQQPEPVVAKIYPDETKPTEKIPDFFLEKEKRQQPQPEPQPEINSSPSDPFDGIKTEDIEDFAELFDTPPPSSDKEAFEMAKKIRKWIADGRPK